MRRRNSGGRRQRRTLIDLPVSRCGSASASTSATSSFRATICSAMPSISRPGWRLLRSRAGFASRVRCGTRSGQSCPLSFIDLGQQQVKNIAQPIKAYRIRGETSPTATPVVGSSLPLPDKPSIAVLPFANMSGDPEQEYFADGMVEEIITALCRIRWLFVIARNSTFTYKGQAIDVKQVGRELGVRYVLEGSVRKAGQRVRITGQLIDATNWHASLGRPLRRLARRRIRASGQSGGQRRRGDRTDTASRRNPPIGCNRPTDDLTAYDLYLRAYAMFWSSARHISEALRLAGAGDRARSALRPRARLGRVCCHCAASLTTGAKTRRRIAAKASISPGERCKSPAMTPGVLANAALALAYFGEDIGRA